MRRCDPKLVPNEFHGKTGLVLNWKPPTTARLPSLPFSVCVCFGVFNRVSPRVSLCVCARSFGFSFRDLDSALVALQGPLLAGLVATCGLLHGRCSCLCRVSGEFSAMLWMEDILQHLRGMMSLLQMPTSHYFPLFQSGAGVCPSTKAMSVERTT